MTLRIIPVVGIVGILAGCSTLPRDGPSARAVRAGAQSASAESHYAIFDLDYAASERIKAVPSSFLGSLSAGGSDEIGGLIGAGDGLAVTIFEPSGALFGGGSGGNVRSGAQTLPVVAVNTDGSIPIPFAGLVQVAGMTTTQAAAAIRRALIGKVGNPQVVVAMTENASNAVTILGEIRSPGRAPLTTNANRIVDVIAARGGTARAPEDVQVVVNRNGETFTAPMSAVVSDFGENIRLARGDQINLVYKPRRFSTFGALGAVTQVEIGAGTLNLTGALSKVGGLDNNSANARSVLVFRFERPEVAQALGITQRPTERGIPVVYRINLEDAASFFVANNFQIQTDDVIYVPRSDSAEIGKFFTLVRTFTGAIYDISATNALTRN